MSDNLQDQPAEKRQLAAILASDIVGYSKMMEADERETLKRLRDLRAGIIQPTVAEHHGRIFKTMGDGFLVEFASVIDAVHCAVAIQRALMSRNRDVPETAKLMLRIGVNLGDVFHEGEDVFGDGVNIAARLEALAPPGGICVSRSVREQVREKLNFDFSDLGEHQVKNITRPIQVFGINFDGAPPAASRPPSRHSPFVRRKWLLGVAGLVFLAILAALAYPPLSARHSQVAARPPAWSAEDRRMSFAVLPFSLAEPSEKLKESNDLLEEILPTILAEDFSVGKVLSKAQLSQDDRSGAAQQIGARLGVAFVVQGTARQEDDYYAVLANLTEVSSGRIVSTQTLQIPLKASRSAFEDYAGNLARALVTDALKAEVQKLAFMPEEKWDARDWLNSKWARGETSSKEFYQDSLRRVTKALELAPDMPLVQAEAGTTYAFLFALGFSDDPESDRRRAQELLRKALNANSENPRAWMGMSFLYDTESDWENAAMADEKALARWPHNPSLYQNLAGDYANLGREKEAIDLINRKRRENFNFYDYANLGFAYFVLGDLPAAERNLQSARAFYLPEDLKTNINAAQNEVYLASTLAQMGRLAEARNVLARIADVPSVATMTAVKTSLGKRIPPGTETLLAGLRKAGLPE